MPDTSVPWKDQRFVRTLVAVWRSSLPLRVIASTLIASVVVVLLGGQFFLNRARSGIVEAKKQASKLSAEAEKQIEKLTAKQE